MDHFEGLESFRYGDAPLRPISWLEYDYERHPPCEFADFPILRGWGPSDNMRALRSADIDSRFISVTVPMLQAWLFIGSLESMAGRRIIKTEFLRYRLGRPVVSTRFLAQLLGSWEELVTPLPEAERHDWSGRIRTILSEIQFWCFKLASHASASDNPTRTESAPSAIDATCRLLTLVGETINTSRTYLRTSDSGDHRGFVGVYTPDQERRLVLQVAKAKWCPSMAKILMSYRYSVAEYAAFWNRVQAWFGPCHNRCSPKRCVAYDVDTSRYTIRHETPSCCCGFVVPSLADISTLILSGKIPVIKLSTDPLEDASAAASSALGNISLEVLDSRAAMSQGGYAAISHVWSDRIGSHTAQGLPACVVQALFQQAKAYKRRYIWIDSLCAPEETVARKKAIQLMAETYRKADITIVLDSQMRSIKFALGPASLEVTLLMLLTSPWMQRLWTLQEAVLSKCLVFQFRNCLTTASDLYLALYNALQGRMNPITQVLGNELFRILQSATDLPVTNDMGRGLELGQVYKMIKIRGTSKAKDEPVVMANLLNLDVGTLLDADDLEERMQRLFIMLGKVPSDVILANRPRMRTPRFFWAPRSLLMSGPVEDERWSLSVGSSVQWAEVLENGRLRGEYSVTLLSQSVTVGGDSYGAFHSENRVFKVKASNGDSEEPGDALTFNALAMLPHLGREVGLKLAAGLFSIGVGVAPLTFRYSGRLLVGDSGVYKFPSGASGHIVDARALNGGKLTQIVIE